jgi:hypothetical protein
MFKGGTADLLAGHIEIVPRLLHLKGGVKDADAIGGLGLNQAEADLFCVLEDCNVLGETNNSLLESLTSSYFGGGHMCLSKSEREERRRMRVKEKVRKRRTTFIQEGG